MDVRRPSIILHLLTPGNSSSELLHDWDCVKDSRFKYRAVGKVLLIDYFRNSQCFLLLIYFLTLCFRRSVSQDGVWIRMQATLHLSSLSKFHISLWDRIHIQSYTYLHQMCFKLKPLMFGDGALPRYLGVTAWGGLPRQKLSQFKHPES